MYVRTENTRRGMILNEKKNSKYWLNTTNIVKIITPTLIYLIGSYVYIEEK